MSEPIPESIPTSADPRSRRAYQIRQKQTVKLKGNMELLNQQSKRISSLFSHPERHTQIPQPPKKRRAPSPPEIVANVQGSSAGAGSGEFHVYKASRRREYERLRIMEEEMLREKADEAFAVKRAELQRKDELHTARNKARREKARARKEKFEKEKAANAIKGSASIQTAPSSDEAHQKNNSTIIDHSEFATL